MLELEIKLDEVFDERTMEFIPIKTQTLKIEHSLISVSKWESIWHKPFMSKDNKTPEENMSYVRCMTINKVDDIIYEHLSAEDIEKISKYIEDPMTATTFSKKETGGSGEIVTSELIYYWMVALQIPYEFEKWHLNRLLTLIRVCNIKNQPPKKLGSKALASRNSALNAARRQRHHTRG